MGVVVDWLDGRPLGQQASVQLHRDSGGSHIATIDSAGSYVAADLAPGSYRISVRALGYLPADTTCVVVAGQVDTLILMLDAEVAGTIRVRPATDRYAKSRPPRGACCGSCR